MHWQFTPFALPEIIAGAVTIWLAIITWRRRSAPGALPFFITLLAATDYSLGYAMQLGSFDVPTAIFWNNVQWPAAVVLPLAWLAFTLQYTGHRQWLTRRRMVLLSNAVKFTEQGEVVLSVEANPTENEGPVPVPDRDGLPTYELHLAVRDSGIGISEEGRGRLFHSFSQVDASTTRRYGGTGLGLAISKRLAELMGGRMWVESESGVGSPFISPFWLRLLPRPHAPTCRPTSRI